jgi:hypothetical protein
MIQITLVRALLLECNPLPNSPVPNINILAVVISIDGFVEAFKS